MARPALSRKEFNAWPVFRVGVYTSAESAREMAELWNEAGRENGMRTLYRVLPVPIRRCGVELTVWVAIVKREPAPEPA